MLLIARVRSHERSLHRIGIGCAGLRVGGGIALQLPKGARYVLGRLGTSSLTNAFPRWISSLGEFPRCIFPLGALDSFKVIGGIVILEHTVVEYQRPYSASKSSQHEQTFTTICFSDCRLGQECLSCISWFKDLNQYGSKMLRPCRIRTSNSQVHSPVSTVWSVTAR